MTNLINKQAFSHNKLKVSYMNARSLLNKFSDFEEIAFSENYYIIDVTESLLCVEVRDYLVEYKIPCYTILKKKKSRLHKNGEGIILYMEIIVSHNYYQNFLSLT